jgi:hypothetical protein
MHRHDQEPQKRRKNRGTSQTCAYGRDRIVVVAGGGEVPPRFHRSVAPAGAFLVFFPAPHSLRACAMGWVLTPLPRLKMIATSVLALPLPTARMFLRLISADFDAAHLVPTAIDL